MNIRLKLIAAFVLISLFSATIGYVGVRSIVIVKTDLDEVVRQSIPIIEELENLRFAGIRIVSSTSEFILILSEIKAKGMGKGMGKGMEKGEVEEGSDAEELYYSSFDRYEKLVLNHFPEENEFLHEIKTAGELLLETSRDIIKLKKSGISGMKILEVKEEFELSERQFLRILDNTLNHEHDELTAKQKNVENSIKNTVRTITGFSLISILTALFLGIFTSYSISMPLRNLSTAAIEIGNGNLDVQVKIQSNDEIGILAKTFNQMASNLRTTTVSKDFVDNIIQTMTDIVIVLDPKSNIQLVNRAALESLNYDEDELNGQPAGLLFYGEDLKSHVKFSNFLDEVSVSNYVEKMLLTKDKQTIPVLFSAAIMSDEIGDTTGIVCVAKDITQSKEVEEKIRKTNEELVVANEELKNTQMKLVQSAKLASIGELATGIAHELNQPLGYIRSSAQLVTINGIGNLNIHEAFKALTLVEEGTTRMMKIINHLRSFAHPPSIDRQSIDLHKVINNSLILITEELRLKNITVKKKFAPDFPHFIGNAQGLEQVFINIISNAKDTLTGREAATLIIKTEFRPQKNGKDQLAISFRDNGCGIPQSAIEKIFDPFFTTKEIGKGTGLGLSISYGIIKEHQGEIQVSSIENEGSSFTVVLPAKSGSRQI